jgi:hypothetical protein
MQIPAFKLERYFAEYEFNVDYVLCPSDCESLSIQDLLALEPNAAERFHQHWLGYTESMGSPSLRKEICSLYRDVQPDQVLVHAGAEGAIFLFMHAVLKAKDHENYCRQSEGARSVFCLTCRSIWMATAPSRFDWISALAGYGR